MWDVLGGATVFGIIVALGAWINGRVTRREISRLIAEEHKATRELIASVLSKMDERLTNMNERFAKMDERFAKMDERFELLIKAIELHSRASAQQHEEIMKRLGST